MADEDPRQLRDQKQSGYPPPGGIFNTPLRPLIQGGGNLADTKEGTVPNSAFNPPRRPR